MYASRLPTFGLMPVLCVLLSICLLPSVITQRPVYCDKNSDCGLDQYCETGYGYCSPCSLICGQGGDLLECHKHGCSDKAPGPTIPGPTSVNPPLPTQNSPVPTTTQQDVNHGPPNTNPNTWLLPLLIGSIVTIVVLAVCLVIFCICVKKKWRETYQHNHSSKMGRHSSESSYTYILPKETEPRKTGVTEIGNDSLKCGFKPVDYYGDKSFNQEKQLPKAKVETGQLETHSDMVCKNCGQSRFVQNVAISV